MRLARAGFRALIVALSLVLPFGVASAEPVTVDRAVVRFSAPELGGARTPRFVFARMLAFEARLEALADPDRPGVPYRDRHLSAALERHVAETLLSSLRIEPEPEPAAVSAQAEAARRMTEARCGGASGVAAAARAEGISERELFAFFRRQARASLYLDRMVAPMLMPSDAELRRLYRSERTPFRDAPFESTLPALRRWYVSTRLAAAVSDFYQNARARLEIQILNGAP
jgi:hypothetical protein